MVTALTIGRAEAGGCDGWGRSCSKTEQPKASISVPGRLRGCEMDPDEESKVRAQGIHHHQEAHPICP